jgi:hypothetical protein
MALFYRVETSHPDRSERKGAYRPMVNKELGSEYDTVAGMAGLDSADFQRHPLPQNDARLFKDWESICYNDEERNFLFGFSDLLQFLSWFYDKAGRSRITNHAVVAIYEVPDCYMHLGQFQAIAHFEHMVHVKDLCPLTLQEADPEKFKHWTNCQN